LFAIKAIFAPFIFKIGWHFTIYTWENQS